MDKNFKLEDVPPFRSSVRLEDIPYLPDQHCPHGRKLRHWCPECKDAAIAAMVSIRQLYDPEGRGENYHAL